MSKVVEANADSGSRSAENNGVTYGVYRIGETPASPAAKVVAERYNHFGAEEGSGFHDLDLILRFSISTQEDDLPKFVIKLTVGIPPSYAARKAYRSEHGFAYPYERPVYLHVENRLQKQEREEDALETAFRGPTSSFGAGFGNSAFGRDECEKLVESGSALELDTAFKGIAGVLKGTVSKVRFLTQRSHTEVQQLIGLLEEVASGRASLELVEEAAQTLSSQSSGTAN
jgi:hypothetical protein